MLGKAQPISLANPLLVLILLQLLHSSTSQTIGCFGSTNIYNCTPGAPHFPLDLPKTPISPLQLSGYWNHYKAYNLNLGPYSNLDSYWTPIGINDLSGVAVGTSGNENRTISGVLMNITWTLHYGPSLGCAGFFEAAFVTNDGEYNTLVLLTYQGINNPEYRYYTILYTDYNNVKISFRCGEQNFKTNVCDNPVVVVQTRQHPSLLTDDQKQSIDLTIDAVLSPYCISSKQLNLTPYNTSLPLCAPEEPTDFVLLINLLAKYF